MLRSQKFWNVCPKSQDPEQTLSSCWAPAENQSQNKQRQKLHLTDPVETAVTTQVENHLKFFSQKTLMTWEMASRKALSGSLFNCGQENIFFLHNCKQKGSTLVTIKCNHIKVKHLFFLVLFSSLIIKFLLQMSYLKKKKIKKTTKISSSILNLKLLSKSEM